VISRRKVLFFSKSLAIFDAEVRREFLAMVILSVTFGRINPNALKGI